MFNVSWGWLYTHSRWSVSRHHTHDGRLIWWSSFTGAVILMLHGQCVTQVARGDIVIIVDWCLCDFLVLKHIDEVYAHFIFICHLVMLTYFCAVNVPEFQYCFWLFTDVDYFLCSKCSHHFWMMFMWFPCSETYWWSVHTSSSFVIDWCWHFCLWKIF